MHRGWEFRPLFEEFLRAVPAVELHLHLEGSLRPSTLRDLAQVHGLRTPPLLPCHDWNTFLACWKGICQVLKRPADFKRVALELGEDLHRRGVVYAEIFFSPEPHTRHHGLSFDQIFGALESARLEVSQNLGAELRWIADGVRDSSTGVESCRRTVEWMASLDDPGGLVALGLGGDERKGPPELFKQLFARARALGFHTVAHAGESIDNVGATIDCLEVERIGHGIRAASDKALCRRLKQRGVTLEVCPTSNLVLNNASDLSAVRRLLEQGVSLCLNSDDPGILGVNLKSEVSLVARELQLAPARVLELLQNGVKASFAPEQRKAGWLREQEEVYRRWFKEQAPLSPGY